MKSARELCRAGASDRRTAVVTGTRATQAGFSSAGASFPVCSGRSLLIIDNQIRLYCHVLGRCVRFDSIFASAMPILARSRSGGGPNVVSGTLMNLVESFLINKRVFSREPLH
jgi:hypothetical protein